jgi:hypothetical protein
MSSADTIASCQCSIGAEILLKRRLSGGMLQEIKRRKVGNSSPWLKMSVVSMPPSVRKASPESCGNWSRYFGIFFLRFLIYEKRSLPGTVCGRKLVGTETGINRVFPAIGKVIRRQRRERYV